MCGIVGAASSRNIVPVLIDGVRRLEYRGYDSTGLAVIADGDGASPAQLRRVVSTARVANLEATVAAGGITGTTGISHTRWATHGAPTPVNAHPHTSGGEIAVVHNGIIENWEALRDKLVAQGYVFATQTDTEVIAHLVHAHWHAPGGGDLLRAVQAATAEFHGAYAIAVVSTREPGRVVGARNGSPLVVGLGDGDHFLASDAAALLSVTRRVAYLEEGDIADIRREGVRDRRRHAATRVDRPVITVEASSAAVELGPYRHFMQKEIFEQPRAVADTLESVGGIGPELFGADGRRGAAAGRPRADPRLRHQLLRGHGRAAVDRIAGADPLRSRDRQRIPLPRQRAASVDAGRRGVAVRRDRRHAGGAQARAGAGTPAHARHLQRADELDGAPDRTDLPDARRHRSRRRVDQGVHHAAGRAVPAGAHAGEERARASRRRRRRSGCAGCGTCRRRCRRRWRWSRRSSPGPSASRRRSTRCSSAAASTTRSRSKARSSSRKSRTSTPRRTRRASSSTARWRWSTPTCRWWRSRPTTRCWRS